VHPQKLEPPLFNKNGSCKNSVLMFKDKNPKVTTDYLLGLFMDHVVKMYNFNRSSEIMEDPGVKKVLERWSLRWRKNT